MSDIYSPPKGNPNTEAAQFACKVSIKADYKSRLIYRTKHNPQKGSEQRIQCWHDCCHHGTKFLW